MVTQRAWVFLWTRTKLSTEKPEKGSKTELSHQPVPTLDGASGNPCGAAKCSLRQPGEERGGCCTAGPAWQPFCWDKSGGSRAPHMGPPVPRAGTPVSTPARLFAGHAWLPPRTSSFLWSIEIMASEQRQLRVRYFPCQAASPSVALGEEFTFQTYPRYRTEVYGRSLPQGKLNGRNSSYSHLVGFALSSRHETEKAKPIKKPHTVGHRQHFCTARKLNNY